MHLIFGERSRSIFAPPHYLAPSLSGIDLSTSGVKAVRLAESPHGLTLANYSEVKLPFGAFADGEVVDRAAVANALSAAAQTVHISTANAALPEPKSFLFEATVAGTNKSELRIAVEQQLDELIPLPPKDTNFDFVKVQQMEQGQILVAGIGFARRVVDDTLAAFDSANIPVQVLEGETFAMARSLLHKGDESTVFIIDIGKTTTKMSVVERRLPRFAATINIGGHSLTLAVQKHFGVTESDARKIKADRGIVSSAGNEDYLAAMLSTVSAIRDEVSNRLEYWQKKIAHKGTHEPVSRAILIGGNASVRGLPEYLEGALQIPVATGDVFTNLASRDAWVPSLDYTESLAYATAIGLALYNHDRYYA